MYVVQPGDTLYLRGGTYYECVTLTVAGTAGKPITIRSYPGEVAILDGGIREFYEDPANAWEPFPQGAEGEFRSKKSYAFGGGFGNFGDSMVPFHRYLNFADLRTSNEFYRQELNKSSDFSKNRSRNCSLVSGTYFVALRTVGLDMSKPRSG